MNPVIQRELRVQARNPALHRLRVLALLAVTGTLMFLFVTQPLRSGAGGTSLFLQLNSALTAVILLTGPALTADCLSRERREGTLGLLFLTPLRPRDVVSGKGFVQFLRVASLGLAAVPVMMLPLLLGGVGVSEITLALSAHWLAAAIGLGSGLVASSLVKSPVKALMLAYSLTALAAICFSMARFFVGLALINTAGGRAATVLMGVGWMLVALLGGGMIFRLSQQFAATRLAAVWNVETQAAKPRPPSALEMPVPFLAHTARRWNRALLAQNPLSWLHQRSIWSALGRWGWVLLAIFLWFGAFFTSAPLLLLEKLLLLGMCFTAARAFRDEKQNGTLELLLVTPLTERQLLLSLLRLVVRHFAPPVLLHLGLWLYARQLPQWESWEFRPCWLLLSSLVTLPGIGGWVSLRSRHYLMAVTVTVFFGVAVPLLLPDCVPWLMRLASWGAFQLFVNTPGVVSPLPSYAETPVDPLWSLGVQLALGGLAWAGLAEDLRRRKFITRPVES